MTDQQRYEVNLRAAERAHDQATEIAYRLNEAAMRDAQVAICIVCPLAALARSYDVSKNTISRLTTQ